METRHPPGPTPQTPSADWTLRRAAVIGAGPMGSLLAAALAPSGPTVIVCRNAERAAQILRDGVRVRGLLTLDARPMVVRRVSDLRDIGGFSAVFVATKTTSLQTVAADLRPVLPALSDSPAGVMVISFQNGIEPGRVLADLLGHPGVLRMVLTLGAVMDRNTGRVDVTLDSPPHFIGAPSPAVRGPCEKIAAALTAGGLRTVFTPDIERVVWEKGIVNAAMNPVAALVDANVGQVLDSPARVLVDRLLAEGIAVARAEGIALPADYASRAMTMMEHARGHVPSMVHDIREGRESEVGQLNRQVIAHARRLGVPVPTHEIIEALIETFDWKIYRRGARI